VQPMPYY